MPETPLTVADVCRWLDQFAPPILAEDWDNTGLLAGDPGTTVRRIMTCLTVTPESAAEAIERKADLIVTHHPLPFRPLQRLTTEQTPTRLLWELANAQVAIYSPHTAFDSAPRGINQRLARRLGLSEIEVLIPNPSLADQGGSGRMGVLPPGSCLRDLLDRVTAALQPLGMRFTGHPEQPATRIACACGSGGSFLAAAVAAGCDAMVTGEADFHTCLEARAQGIGLVLAGHYFSERFALEELADSIRNELSVAEVWASEKESNPLSLP